MAPSTGLPVQNLGRNAAGLNGCATGAAKITKGYNLPAKWVIHTVGPVWRGGKYNEEEILAQCYQNCLKIAQEYGIKTLAFPAISTGAYGFPLERACRIAVREVRDWLAESQTLEKVILVCFDRITYEHYLWVLKNF
jgi:O-acetyl-ADP-ribose deacetylase (regulator of RNase III)